MRYVSSSIRLRSLVTLVLLSSFLVSAGSGIALYARPEGSLARWTNWSLLGMDKKQWEGVHTAFVLVFFLTSLLHLAYNWKPALSCLKSRAALIFSSGTRVPLMKEGLLALGVLLLVFFGSLRQWQPFSAVFDLRTAIKDGKYTARVSPPAIDADRLSVAALCKVASLSEDEALHNARKRGILIEDASLPVAKIAKKYDVSPEQVFLALRGD